MNDARRFAALLDALAESVAEASDEELLDEAAEDGRGAEDAERVRAVLLEAVRKRPAVDRLNGSDFGYLG